MRTIQIAICDDEKQFIEKPDSTIKETGCCFYVLTIVQKVL